MTPRWASAFWIWSALAPLLLSPGACEGVVPEPNFERMIDQRGYRPYAPAPQFADGRAMRPPPVGSISRDRIIGEPALTEGVEGGSYVGRVPIRVDRALLERGRGRFDIFCAACHGQRGDGVSGVAAAMELRRPPSLLEAPVTAFPPGRLFEVISLGYGLMPSYRHELPITDRWATVAYIAALQLSQRASLATLPVEARAQAERVLK